MESQKRTAKWDKNEWLKISKIGDEIHKKLAHAIDKGLNHECEEVQNIIDQHYQIILNNLWLAARSY